MKQIEFEYWALYRSLYRGSIHAAAATYNLLPQACVGMLSFSFFVMVVPMSICERSFSHSIVIVGCCNPRGRIIELWRDVCCVH
jgi:hypothetical protein